MTQGNSSIGRVAVSKTVGCGFESLFPCQTHKVKSTHERALLFLPSLFSDNHRLLKWMISLVSNDLLSGFTSCENNLPLGAIAQSLDIAAMTPRGQRRKRDREDCLDHGAPAKNDHNRH